MAQGGHRHQAHGPGPQHRHRGPRLDFGPQGGVNPARHRLDHDRQLVAHLIGHVVELGPVGYQLGGPAAPRGLAEAGLQAGLEMAAHQMPVVVAVAGGGSFEGRVEAPGLMAQHRLDDHPAAPGQLPDDLVAQHERERDEVVEVAGRPAVHGG